MNSASSKIVYECVSQRDLTSIWPDAPTNGRDNNNTSLIHYSHHDRITSDTNELHGLARLTSFVTQVWKNPRYYRWVLTVVISLNFALIIGLLSSYGALYMCLREDLESSATETGWVASVAWSICIFSPVITSIYQRLGVRKLSAIGIILCFIGLFASTFAQHIWILFLTFGGLFGVGVSVVFVSSVNMITAYFESHECAMPTTLPGLGATTGMLVFSPVLEIVFKRFGWRMSLRVVAGIILVIGLGGTILYRLPPSPERTSKSKTSSESEEEKRLRKEAKLEEKESRLRKSKDNYKRLLRDPAHWVFGLANLICNMLLLCSVINLVELLTVAGYSAERSAFFMSVLGLVDAGGRIITAIIGDRLPCSRIMVLPVMCILNGAASFMLTVTTDLVPVIIYMTVTGIGRSVVYSIIYACSVETFGHPVYEESFAIMFFLNGIGCLFSPLIPGLSFDLTGSYSAANYCFSVLWLAASAMFIGVYFITNWKRKKNRFQNNIDTHAADEEATSCLEKSLKVENCHEADDYGYPGTSTESGDSHDSGFPGTSTEFPGTSIESGDFDDSGFPGTSTEFPGTSIESGYSDDPRDPEASQESEESPLRWDTKSESANPSIECALLKISVV